jgi:hypothetical protein
MHFYLLGQGLPTRQSINFHGNAVQTFPSIVITGAERHFSVAAYRVAQVELQRRGSLACVFPHMAGARGKGKLAAFEAKYFAFRLPCS